MKHSIYIQLAIILVKADLRREEREWQRKVRRTRYDVPWQNAHLLRDIGLDFEGHAEGIPDAVIAERRVRHFRRVIASRPAT